MKVFYFRSIIKCVIFTVLLVWCIFKIVTHTPLFAVSSFKGDFRTWYEQHIGIIDITLKVVLGITFSFCFFCFAVPFYLDIPDMIGDNYQYVEGTVLTGAYSSRDNERLITIRDDITGDEKSVRVFYSVADEGDYIKVKYLRHSKQGIVVKHVKK